MSSSQGITGEPSGFSSPKIRCFFSKTVHPNSIDAICQDLKEPTEPVGESFQAQAAKCIQEAKQYAKGGRFLELTSRLRGRHVAALRQRLTVGNIEPQRSNENQFIVNYKTKLAKVKRELVVESGKHKRVRDYIVSQLPTFIYMDDYKRFQGRSNLLGLRERLNNDNMELSEEDETFLMILKLSGLDLDQLIEQGESQSQHVIHDRQIDLQDAATTLTKSVAGRWDQNDYQIQFRAGWPGFLHRDRGDRKEYRDDPP